MAKAEGQTTIATNRAARHQFFIEDSFECGIMLRGSEDMPAFRQGGEGAGDGACA